MASGGTWGCNRNENGTGSYWGMRIECNLIKYGTVWRDLMGFWRGEEMGIKLKALTHSISDTKQESFIPQVQ